LGGIGSNSVEKKISFFSEEFLFRSVLRIEKTVYCRVVPCPGKKAFASPKKAVTLFSECGLPPFQPGGPSATASLCGNEKGNGKVSPGPFWFRRLLFFPGNKESGSNKQPIWRGFYF